VTKKRVVIHLEDAGQNLHYAKHGKMGVSLRILENGHCQVIKVAERSVCATIGIQPMWELMELNGYNIEFHNDEEAYARFNNSVDQLWPMEMVFNTANALNIEEEDEI
jgi:hypothetical protein